MIGLKIYKTKILKNFKGNILKYINKNDKFIKKFGEVYFSYIKKGKQKGWNLHKKNNCFLICVDGTVHIHLIDGRKRKKSFNSEKKIKLSKNQPKILKIPPGIWFSFKSIKSNSILSNFMETTHQKKESIKSSVIKGYSIKD
mgnify:FL=1